MAGSKLPVVFCICADACSHADSEHMDRITEPSDNSACINHLAYPPRRLHDDHSPVNRNPKYVVVFLARMNRALAATSG